MILEITSENDKILIIFAVAILIIIISLLVYFFVSKKKNKVKELEHTQNSNENQVSYQEQNIQNQVLEEEVLIPQAEELEITEVQEETNKNVDDIESMLKEMQHDLDASKEETFMEGIDRYEVEEEENAIISYKELMKYKENRQKEMILEEKKPSEIKEVIIEKEEEPKEEVKKFKRSEFISPIFGLNEEPNVTYKEIKRPPRKETPQTNEVKDKNDNFYDALVDFRNKLN